MIRGEGSSGDQVALFDHPFSQNDEIGDVVIRIQEEKIGILAFFDLSLVFEFIEQSDVGGEKLYGFFTGYDLILDQESEVCEERLLSGDGQTGEIAVLVEDGKTTVAIGTHRNPEERSLFFEA